MRQLGVDGISRAQVSEIARGVDDAVEAFRARPLQGPFPSVWLDALAVGCRDDRLAMAGVCRMVAVGVNAEGRREVLGVEVVTSEDGAGWTGFLRGLAARGLQGVQLVNSDAHPGLVEAACSVMAGAARQRCRTHYLRNLLTGVPKSAQPLAATLVRSIFAQPDAAQVAAQHERVGPARGALPGGGGPFRRGRPRDPRLHRLPQGALAAASGRCERSLGPRDPVQSTAQIHWPPGCRGRCAKITRMAFRVEGIDHVALTVADAGATAAWYRDVLGLERENADVWGDTPVAMMAQGSGVALFGAQAGGEPALGVRHVAFRVDRENFEAAQADLRRRGIAFELQDHQVSHSIYFRDPDGLVLELTTYETSTS